MARDDDDGGELRPPGRRSLARGGTCDTVAGMNAAPRRRRSELADALRRRVVGALSSGSLRRGERPTPTRGAPLTDFRGVELLLAGTTLTIEDGATFAVHAWEDEAGYEASDYAVDSPQSRRYLDYYVEMGLGAEQAAAFYAMTNSVPFESARWLDGAEMRRWIGERNALKLAYLDLETVLN